MQSDASQRQAEVEVAKERLALAKTHNETATKRAASANELELSAKVMYETATQHMKTAEKNKEYAISQLVSSKKEVEEAERFLREVEKKSNVNGVNIKTEEVSEESQNNIDRKKKRKVASVSPQTSNQKRAATSRPVTSTHVRANVFRTTANNGSIKAERKTRMGELNSLLADQRRRGELDIEYVLVDPDDDPRDLFTDGSRILVRDKTVHTTTWQATILRRHDKSGALGYDIHYKGATARSKNWIRYDWIVGIHFP